MNSATGKSTAGLPLPYSAMRGPVALNSMSIPPACLTIRSRYSSTALSSRASMTAWLARPPSSLICRVTASRVLSVRPARKTSAPSAANFRATAAPIEPAAPNTTARLSFKTGESFIFSSSVGSCVEDDLLGCDLVVVVEAVQPGVADRQLPVRRAIHLGGHHEQGVPAVAGAVGHADAAGHDRLGEQNQAVHVVVDAHEVGAGYVRVRARLGSRDARRQPGSRRVEVLAGPCLHVGAGQLDRW